MKRKSSGAQVTGGIIQNVPRCAVKPGAKLSKAQFANICQIMICHDYRGYDDFIDTCVNSLPLDVIPLLIGADCLSPWITERIERRLKNTNKFDNLIQDTKTKEAR
jgi:hypothetical protein